MVFFEYKGDLFNATKDLHLKNDDLLFAHCISSDFALGAGIAKVFRDKYKVKEQLPHIPIGDRWHGNGYCLITKGELTVANLVTKERCFHKPTYKTLEESLIDLKSHLRGTSELRRTLVMPCIGCGLDKLEWAKVRDIIQRVFNDMCINIYVYKL